MNRFGMLVALMQLLAMVEAACSQDWRRAVVFAGFAVGSAGVAWVD